MQSHVQDNLSRIARARDSHVLIFHDTLTMCYETNLLSPQCVTHRFVTSKKNVTLIHKPARNIARNIYIHICITARWNEILKRNTCAHGCFKEKKKLTVRRLRFPPSVVSVATGLDSISFREKAGRKTARPVARGRSRNRSFLSAANAPTVRRRL